MNTGNFVNTSSNMVQEVKNIIEGYDMGSIRALAQEPVQNALDAVREGQGKVAVEYRLLLRHTASGRSCYLLTVTDSGTTGLRGAMVSDEELEARDFKLKPAENWAAFEAMGYAKENEDALGSRGQGKAAFLYHSHVPGQTRRMLMLYDTLLEDGEYRLGIRFARPVDQRRKPPIYNEEARITLQSKSFQLDGLSVPLGLMPLRDIGTRVIVPYLDEDDVAKFRPGKELGRWLQRCWWHAIQIGKLRIQVIDDEKGTVEEIAVPKWWQDLPRVKGKTPVAGSWRKMPVGGRACIWGELPIDDNHQIRRLVLFHSDNLEEDEITRDQPEYAGIQLLRGSQWIETRGARQEYGDYIPLDKRSGFRGYVEFDKHTDSALRALEKPQHDRFDGKRKIVRNIHKVLKSKVREFSQGMGWEQPQTISNQQVSQREQQTHTRFLETFLNPNGRKPSSLPAKDGRESSQLNWECRLDLDYPDPESARVDWGEGLGNLYVEVAFAPANELMGNADLLLEWVDASAGRQEILRHEGAIRTEWHPNRAQQQFELGDWTVLRGKADPRQQQLSCSEPGECKLRAVIVHRGERVKSAARTVYVQTDPPPPPQQNLVTLSISAENISVSDQQRIDHGQALKVQFSARNRTAQEGAYFFTATFGDEVFARNEPIVLDATPAGDTPRKQAIMTEERQLLDTQQSTPLPLGGIKSLKMPESSGKYQIRAELADDIGNVVANAAIPVYFQLDPGKAKNKLPFEIRQKRQVAMWELNEELTELTYPSEYPIYKELKNLQRQHRVLQDKLAFIAEISANGLLEWAMRPKEQGNDSHFDQLLDESGSLDDPLWDPYLSRLEKLGNSYHGSPIEFAHTWRETVAKMLVIFAQENN